MTGTLIFQTMDVIMFVVVITPVIVKLCRWLARRDSVSNTSRVAYWCEFLFGRETSILVAILGIISLAGAIAAFNGSVGGLIVASVAGIFLCLMIALINSSAWPR